MRKCIICENMLDIDGYDWYESITSADLDKVGVLVFNSDIGDDYTVVSKLCQLKGTEKVIYINEVIDPFMFNIFRGLNAIIIKGSIDNVTAEYLDCLIENEWVGGLIGFTEPSDDLSRLFKCFNTLVENKEVANKMLSSDIWIDTINNTMQRIQASVSMYDDSYKGVVEWIPNMQNVIDQIREGASVTEAKLAELQVTVDKLREEQERLEDNKSVADVYGGILTPSVFEVKQTKKVLYIDSLSPCPYLNTFIFNFMQWVKTQKKKKVKTLLILTNTSGNVSKYSRLPGVTHLNSRTLNSTSIRGKETFVTFEINKKVFEKFFEEDADLYIMLDQSYTDGRVLKIGSEIREYYATSNVSDLERNKIDSSKFNRLITCNVKIGTSIALPFSMDYMTKSVDRNQTNQQRNIALSLICNKMYADSFNRIYQDLFSKGY